MSKHLPPIPSDSPDKRMLDNPARTPEADKRLAVLDEVVRNYQAEYPFIKGATVFGSTMHGGAHEKSDIDAFVFVDPAAVKQELGDATLDEHDYREMARAVEHDLMSRVGLGTDEQSSSGRRNDIQLFLINNEIIDKAVKEYESAQYLTAQHQKEIERLREIYWSTPGADLREGFEEYAIRKEGFDPDDSPVPPLMEWGIAALFHPGVGETSALDQDRQIALDRIAKSPAAEEIWRDIVSWVTSLEGDMHADGVNNFPKTFAEAQESFSIAA